MEATTRKAWELLPGDCVVESDGALLEVESVDVGLRWVYITFARTGIVPVDPLRINAEAHVRVLR